MWYSQEHPPLQPSSNSTEVLVLDCGSSIVSVFVPVTEWLPLAEILEIAIKLSY